MSTAIQDVHIHVPESDMKFFEELAGKMGWTFDTKANPNLVTPAVSVEHELPLRFKKFKGALSKLSDVQPEDDARLSYLLKKYR